MDVAADARHLPVTAGMETVFDQDMDPDGFDAGTIKPTEKSGEGPLEAASIYSDPAARMVP